MARRERVRLVPPVVTDLYADRALSVTTKAVAAALALHEGRNSGVGQRRMVCAGFGAGAAGLPHRSRASESVAVDLDERVE